MNVPAPSNREQDFNEPSQPPQAKFPHKDKLLAATGMSPILQLRPDLGLKISAVLNQPVLGPPCPPTVRIPECKHFVKIENNSLIKIRELLCQREYLPTENP